MLYKGRKREKSRFLRKFYAEKFGDFKYYSYLCAKITQIYENREEKNRCDGWEFQPADIGTLQVDERGR